MSFSGVPRRPAASRGVQTCHGNRVGVPPDDLIWTVHDQMSACEIHTGTAPAEHQRVPAAPVAAAGERRLSGRGLKPPCQKICVLEGKNRSGGEFKKKCFSPLINMWKRNMKMFSSQCDDDESGSLWSSSPAPVHPLEETETKTDRRCLQRECEWRNSPRFCPWSWFVWRKMKWRGLKMEGRKTWVQSLIKSIFSLQDLFNLNDNRLFFIKHSLQLIDLFSGIKVIFMSHAGLWVFHSKPPVSVFICEVIYHESGPLTVRKRSFNSNQYLILNVFIYSCQLE